jgi:hypothetical protein
MERLAEHKLVSWKQQETRKPLLIDGARQAGKSYLIERLFGPKHFKRTHVLDFRLNKAAHALFETSLEPEDIIINIELLLGADINLSTDLIFFDEIGECQSAVDSLKYFAEKRSDIFLCASGSNIGLLGSFPVGKVQLLPLHPLCFEEFLMASGENKLLEHYRAVSRLKIVHDKLWQYLLDYYFVGGMPEAVKTWYSAKNIGTNERARRTSEVHQSLISGYEKDFGKYSGAVNALEIESVFKNIPSQLSKDTDDSVKRYLFKDVIKNKNRYQQLRGAIDWLEKAKLVSKCYPIDSKPITPLKSLIKENIFKLFLFDVGLLGHILEISYREQKQQEMIVKGFIAENYVQNELNAAGLSPTYSWNEGNSQIEFILKTNDGDLLPIEVKSGKRTRAKSLQVYKDKYHPKKTIKLIGSVGGTNTDDVVWPIYYANFLNRLF